MLSERNVAIVKIPFRSRVICFSNNRLLFLFSWERGFSTSTVRNSGTKEPSTLHYEQTIYGEEMHTLITFMLSVMASNIQWMAYRLIYNPLITLEAMHVRLCAVLLYSSKASSLCYTVNSGVV